MQDEEKYVVIFSVTRNMFKIDEIQDGRHRILKI